jgi:organic hydroperoxide reductase OsmC/OhrA
VSVHTATVRWERGDAVFTDGKYSRVHDVRFDGGVSIAGSPAPSVVRPPLSREDAVDPEEMFVASVSMCHMLFFLDFARRAGFVVDRYEDAAEGALGKDDRGRMAMTKVVLRPRIAWSGEKSPTAQDVEDLHHKSHEACFIANAFRGDVVVEGRP